MCCWRFALRMTPNGKLLKSNKFIELFPAKVTSIVNLCILHFTVIIFIIISYKIIHNWITVMTSQIATFMGPAWGPPGSCRPQVGPMMAPWILLSGVWFYHDGVCPINDHRGNPQRMPNKVIEHTAKNPRTSDALTLMKHDKVYTKCQW